MFDSQEIALKLEFGTIEPHIERSLKDSFLEYFDRAESWRHRAMSVQVTDVSQTEIMTEARTIRLALRDIRTSAEKKRKELKEESLRKGKAIDGIYNMLAYAIKPLEDHLLEQENYIQKLEDDRKKALVIERTPLLAQYCEDAGLYDLGSMDEDVFQRLLSGFKDAHEHRILAEKKAEAEKLQREQLEALERERIAEENKKLKAERLIKEKEEKKARQELELKIEQERQAKEALEAQIAHAKRQEQERLEIEEKARREALMAPDMDRLKHFAITLENMPIPQFHDEDIYIMIDTRIKFLVKELRHLAANYEVIKDV